MKVNKLCSIYIHTYICRLYTITIMIIDYLFAGNNFCVLTKNYSREKVLGTFSAISAREKQFFSIEIIYVYILSHFSRFKTGK